MKTLAPSAAIRSSTAFCAPQPSATIVITAPTPMMMPSIVSIDRSAFDRMDEMATAKRLAEQHRLRARGAAPPPPRRRRRRRLLLPHAGHRAAAGDLVHPLLHVLLRLDQARAGQHVHRVARLEALRRTSL